MSNSLNSLIVGIFQKLFSNDDSNYSLYLIISSVAFVTIKNEKLFAISLLLKYEL